MNKKWKWILGITIGLVVLFGLGIVAASFFGGGHMSFGRSAYYGHPMMDDYGFNGRNPMEGYNNYRHPMMGGWGLGGLFMGFGMLLLWAFPVGLLFLVVYGAVRLANKSNTPIAAQTCANCSKPVQADWTTCPYCGTTI